MNIRECMREISSGKNIDVNAGVFMNSMGEMKAKIALVDLSMDYATLYERIDGTIDDKDIEALLNSLNEVIKEVVSDNFDITRAPELTAVIDELRGRIIKKVDVLTANTDVLQVYEYLFNRIQARYEETNTNFDIDDIVKQSFEYIFRDNDNAAINERIKAVLSQLPVRMTKQKFFDIVAESMSIYDGADRSALELYDYMIRTGGTLYSPEGMREYFPELTEKADVLAKADYDNLTKEEFDACFALITEAGSYIENMYDRYQMIISTINHLYAYLLMITYVNKDDDYNYSSLAIKETLEAFNGKYVSVTEFTDVVDEYFTKIEGVLEESLEVDSLMEATFETLTAANMNILEGLCLKTASEAMKRCVLLMSDSEFADFNKITAVGEVADESLVQQYQKKLVADFEERFNGVNKRVRRAIIAETIKTMPVFLNSKDEIEQYIRYALESCSDKAELAGCVASIKLVISEELW